MSDTRRYTFPIELENDPDGRILVRFPDFPEAATDGADLTEALSEAEDCLDVVISGRLIEGDVIPEPSSARGRRTITPTMLVALKAALNGAVKEAGITKSALARELRIDEKNARQLLDPRHNSRLRTLERALHVLGHRVEVRIRTAA